MNSVHEPGSRTMSKNRLRSNTESNRTKNRPSASSAQPVVSPRAQASRPASAASPVPRALRAQPSAPVARPVVRAPACTPAARLRPLAQHARAPSALHACLHPACPRARPVLLARLLRAPRLPSAVSQCPSSRIAAPQRPCRRPCCAPLAGRVLGCLTIQPCLKPSSGHNTLRCIMIQKLSSLSSLCHNTLGVLQYKLP